MRPALACALALIAALPAGAVPAGVASGVRAKQTVRALAAHGPRPVGSIAEVRAGYVVLSRLRALGYEAEMRPFPATPRRSSYNIVARTAGPLRAIVMAHLDGVRAGPAANDNGSGVAVMLEVAREFVRTPGVLFAAVGAEERVETGSRYHLGSLRLRKGLTRADRRSVRLVLSLDMVGYGTSLFVRGLERSPNRSARAALRAARRVGVRAVYHQDTGQSDHAEFTRGGIPAAWIEWWWDPCWHRPCDRPERLVPKKLAAAERLASAAVAAAVG